MKFNLEHMQVIKRERSNFQIFHCIANKSRIFVFFSACKHSPFYDKSDDIWFNRVMLRV